MSNSYFKIVKEVEYPKFQEYSEYTNRYELSLCAFVGNKDTGNMQLTIQTNSSLSNQSRIAYITLNDEEIDKLIFGLLERKLKLISATGEEQSIICPNYEKNT